MSFELTRTSTFQREFQSDLLLLAEYLKTASIVDLEMFKYEAKKYDEPIVRAAVEREEQSRKDANSLF